MPDPIVSDEYDPSWPAQFDALRDRISGAVAEYAFRDDRPGHTEAKTEFVATASRPFDDG